MAESSNYRRLREWLGSGDQGGGGAEVAQRRPAAARPLAEKEASHGFILSAYRAAYQNLANNEFIGGEGWGYNDHPANQALWALEDPISEMAYEYSRNRHRAVPARFARMQERDWAIKHLEYAQGGNMMRYRGGIIRRPPSIYNSRGFVSLFSFSSRRRLLRLLNSVNRQKVRPEQVWFCTLTYPAIWPDDPKDWKKHLKAFRKRLERHYGHLGIIWKLEAQQRGAPHFHLLILATPEMVHGLTAFGERWHNHRRVTLWTGGKLAEFRQFVSQAWYEVVGSEDIRHLAAGVSCEPLESWNKAISYAAKYMGKVSWFADKESGDLINVGRYWGVWHKELWPIRIIRHELGEDDWIRIRRHLRRYQEHKGRWFKGTRDQPPLLDWIALPWSVSAFLPAEVVQRIIALECPWVADGLRYSEIWECERMAKVEAMAAELGVG